jgi:hypothetical protein
MLKRSVYRRMLLEVLEGIRGPTESVGHVDCVGRKERVWWFGAVGGIFLQFVAYEELWTCYPSRGRGVISAINANQLQR